MIGFARDHGPMPEFPIPMRGNECQGADAHEPLQIAFPIPMRGNESTRILVGDARERRFQSP